MLLVEGICRNPEKLSQYRVLYTDSYFAAYEFTHGMFHSDMLNSLFINVCEIKILTKPLFKQYT